MSSGFTDTTLWGPSTHWNRAFSDTFSCLRTSVQSQICYPLTDQTGAEISFDLAFRPLGLPGAATELSVARPSRWRVIRRLGANGHHSHSLTSLSDLQPFTASPRTVCMTGLWVFIPTLRGSTQTLPFPFTQRASYPERERLPLGS